MANAKNNNKKNANANANAKNGKGASTAKETPIAPVMEPETTETDVMEQPVSTPSDPVNEAKEIIADRKVRAFWHKRCSNVKESTMTTLKAEEILKKTDGTATIPAPTEENPDATITVPVYSLKRGKRIYYITDVTPQDITRSEAAAQSKAAEAEAAKEAAKVAANPIA